MSSSSLKDLKRGATIHLMGICGTAMASLAGLLKDLGFELRNLTRTERQKLQVDGVYVKSVYRGSSIERTNMDPGFIIIKVNKKKVSSIAEVIDALQNANDEVQLDGIYEDYPGEYGYKFPMSTK